MKSDLVDLIMQMHAQTAKAILVSDNGEKEKAVWLPKSQIEFVAENVLQAGIVTVTLPEWLAIDKGLL